MQGPEIAASFHLLMARAAQSGDAIKPGEVVYLDPHPFKAAHADAHSDTTRQEYTKDQRSELAKVATSSSDRCLIVCPVQSVGPQRWTAIVAAREIDGRFQVSWYDSLEPSRPTAQAEARVIMAMLVWLLGADRLSSPELPPVRHDVVQTDGYSCGHHVLAIFEEGYRRHRGERHQACVPPA